MQTAGWKGAVPELVFKSHLPEADLLTFWFSHFGFPFLVKVPKGDHLVFPGLLGK